MLANLPKIPKPRKQYPLPPPLCIGWNWFKCGMTYHFGERGSQNDCEGVAKGKV